MKVLLSLLLLLSSAKSAAFCFEAAGTRYSIDPLLLRAIATVESQLNASAINHNRDKKTGKILSSDYGVMQINSTHIAGLRSAGIIRSHQDLLDNPCLNVQTGAWILARHFQTCRVSWNCLGSYNAGFKDRNDAIREAYASRVYQHYRRLMRDERGISLSPGGRHAD
ncbi:TPA: lytic transglycosylase domain-containing protein [Klebsiella quasipneumoniae]|uniref:lytic transglycosylase domain-containing protein n=1 Tax=Klebsiella quasipneumoniae TaxID=1463165 RepID=UPI00352A04BE